MRIVSICPSNTEILHDLGLGPFVVGLDDHSDWPPEWQHLPRVGPDLSIDMDKVAALKPDLVVASLSVPGMEKNVQALAERGIPHIVLNPARIDDIPADIRRVGEAAGVERRAEERARLFEDKVAALRDATVGVERLKLYWEWWPNPIYTLGRDNWLTDVSELAGGCNIFADFAAANVKATREMVRARDPDHICVVWPGVDIKRIKPAMITGRPEWRDVTAIVRGRVHILEEALFCRPSPRLLDGLKQLTRLLHPELSLPW